MHLWWFFSTAIDLDLPFRKYVFVDHFIIAIIKIGEQHDLHVMLSCSQCYFHYIPKCTHGHLSLDNLFKILGSLQDQIMTNMNHYNYGDNILRLNDIEIYLLESNISIIIFHIITQDNISLYFECTTII